MTAIKAAITGVHGYVPPNKLTNFDLANMMDTNDEWIQTRTGIKERRIASEKGVGVSDLAVEAVKGLLAKTNTSKDEIDAIVFATVTGDYVFPAAANVLAKKLDIVNAMTFDVNAACSGFIYGLTIGNSFVCSNQFKKVIVVGADKMSSIVNYEDRATSIIFGDGAGAVLLEPAKDDNGIHDCIMRSDGLGVEFLVQKAGGSVAPPTYSTIDNSEHFVFQDGRTVFKYAVKAMADVSEEILDRNGVSGDELHWLVPHQANKRIIDATARRCGIDENKIMLNIAHYGNTTAGTIPLCLWDYESKLNRGDKLVLTAFGGGFTWGAIYLTWAI